jgi:succinate dehydrogenase/fumarate reductase cytochrome b subunit
MTKFLPIVFVRVFHRWSGMALIVFVGLKILSGYVAAGNLAVFGQETANRIHYALWIDIPLLFLFIFHSFYGLFKILNPAFSGKQRPLFYLLTLTAAVLFVVAVIFIYIV